MSEPWSNLAQVVYRRTYSRSDQGVPENWPDTVERVIAGNIRGHNVPDAEVKILRKLITERKAMPGGRGLWYSGTPGHAKLGGVGLCNCWGLVCDSWEKFVTTQDLLMLGGGVGESVEARYVSQIPKVKKGVHIVHKYTKDADFIVPDSREGWNELARRVYEAYFVTGRGFTYSTICVRGAGERIVGFGGTASGPGPLIAFVDKLCAILAGREGKRIRPIDAADVICSVGEMVVSGNVRRCLPQGALVHTVSGLVPIENIHAGDLVITTKGPKRVVRRFDQGVQDLIRIHTEDGVFDCTSNHRMAVMTSPTEYKWVEAGDLMANDRLASSRIPVEGGTATLPQWSYVKPDHSTTCQDITIPPLDEDIAWLIGLFQTDGYTYANLKDDGFNAYVSIVLGENEFHIAEKAREVLSRFGTRVALTHRKDENSWMVHSQSKQLATYMHLHVKQPKTELVVPEWIRGNSLAIRMAYLAGVLDGDGAAGNRPVQLVSTVYEKFARQVQAVAYSCGFETRVKESSGNWKSRKEGWQKQFFVCFITNRSKRLMATCPQLLKTIRQNLGSQSENGFPSEWIKKDRTKLHANANSNVCVTHYERIYPDSLKTICPVRVVKIEPVHAQPTFDIEVEDVHEFFCNGYLTHNSALLLLGDPWDKDFLRAKRWDLGPIPTQRSRANFSVCADDIEDLHPLFWKTYEAGEAFGIMNRTAMQKFARIGELKRDTAVITNPCAEATLEDGESCNLLEIALPRLNDAEEFELAGRMMFRWGKRVALEPFHVGAAVIAKNQRVGIGITGALQAPTMFCPETLDRAYAAIQDENAKYSKYLGQPESIRTTVVKPSGTLSKLMDVDAEGIHGALARHQIQRIRFGGGDLLLPALQRAGHHMEPEWRFDGTSDPNTMVVDFYKEIPTNVPCENEGFDTWKQLETLRTAQRHWADQSVSVTVYYRREEIEKIKEWVSGHLSDLKTISFLPASDHGFRQAPKEAITADEYERLSAKIKPLDLDGVGESDSDPVDGCAGGACPVR